MLTPYTWVTFGVRSCTFSHQLCFYRSQHLCGKWHMQVSGPILCLCKPNKWDPRGVLKAFLISISFLSSLFQMCGIRPHLNEVVSHACPLYLASQFKKKPCLFLTAGATTRWYLVFVRTQLAHCANEIFLVSWMIIVLTVIDCDVLRPKKNHKSLVTAVMDC